MSQCEAGHTTHRIKKVPTRIGPMFVYDCDSYEDNIEGYCHGKDDISRTLINKGSWEDQDTDEIIAILRKNRDHGVSQTVIDIGCHIGWYSLIAANLGYSVLSIDRDKEHLHLFSKNAAEHLVPERIQTHYHIVGSKWSREVKDFGSKEIELIKIDIEGNEEYAIALIEPLLLMRGVKHIHMEVSPVFNDSYPELVNRIKAFGFKAFLNGKEFDGNYNFDQVNLLFKREDLLQ